MGWIGILGLSPKTSPLLSPPAETRQAALSAPSFTCFSIYQPINAKQWFEEKSLLFPFFIVFPWEVAVSFSSCCGISRVWQHSIHASESQHFFAVSLCPRFLPQILPTGKASTNSVPSVRSALTPSSLLPVCILPEVSAVSSAPSNTEEGQSSCKSNSDISAPSLLLLLLGEWDGLIYLACPHDPSMTHILQGPTSQQLTLSLGLSGSVTWTSPGSLTWPPAPSISLHAHLFLQLQHLLFQPSLLWLSHLAIASAWPSVESCAI